MNYYLSYILLPLPFVRNTHSDGDVQEDDLLKGVPDMNTSGGVR